MYSGEILEVKSAYVEYLDNPVKVYNFEVEDWHTYFVSKSSVFVHNAYDVTKGGKGTDIGKQTAQDIIAKEKKGSINSRFPK